MLKKIENLRCRGSNFKVSLQNIFVPGCTDLLRSKNVWVGDTGASEHCMKDKSVASNVRQGGAVDTMEAHGGAQMWESVLNLWGTRCNQYSKPQLSAKLKDVSYNPRTNFNLFSIGKTIEDGWKMSGNKSGIFLKKGGVKLEFDIKVKMQSCIKFCAYFKQDLEMQGHLPNLVPRC